MLNNCHFLAWPGLRVGLLCTQDAQEVNRNSSIVVKRLDRVACAGGVGRACA